MESQRISSTGVKRHQYNSVSPLESQETGRSASSTLPNPLAGVSSPSEELTRHLTLVDLLAVGIGGTIGSGFFVLTGLVAHSRAGPATVWSWGLSGLAACLSGACYAELCAHIPLSGSAYMYAYISLGEIPAVWAATCLSIEYVAASAAVARCWADKAGVWILQFEGIPAWVAEGIHPDNSFSPLACLLTTATTVLLLRGVQESKRVTNSFTALKILVVAVMVIAGFTYVQPENWKPFSPYGAPGVLRGAASTFFGYLGYDQVSCLAGEAISPQRDLPRAIMGVLFGVTILYMLGTLALTGMESYTEISTVSGFPHAFQSVGAHHVANFVALGEIATLPIVTLITIMAQPRLMYAMSKDGMLPNWFKVVDSGGNLWNGTALAGSVMVAVASAVPFVRLNDVISCAVLTALNLTDTSLIILRHQSPKSWEHLPQMCVLLFHISAIMNALAWKVIASDLLLWVSILGMVGSWVILVGLCPQRKQISRCSTQDETTGLPADSLPTSIEDDVDSEYFKTPIVPFWPCAAIWVNWYLITELDTVGIVGLFGSLAAASLYFVVCTETP